MLRFASAGTELVCRGHEPNFSCPLKGGGGHVPPVHPLALDPATAPMLAHYALHSTI